MSAEPSQPISFEEVLSAEYSVLRPDTGFDTKDRAELYRRVHGLAQPLSALCISGGGIRSATFSLGVIQGLAEQGLLEQFDYLSTVSGGGYIGGWLTAWINRVNGLQNVVPYFKRNAPAPVEGQVDPVQHLREYNNYLSPKLGAFSGDTWTVAATIIRNVFLNWLVLIPLLMFGLMAPRFVLSILRIGEFFEEVHGSADPVSSSLIVAVILPLTAALLFMWSMFNTLRYLPGVGNVDHTVSDFMRQVLVPLAVASVAFCAYDSLYFFGPKDIPTGFVEVSLWMLAPCVSAWLLYLATCGKTLQQRWKLFTGPLSIAILLLGSGTGAAAWVLTNYLFVTTTWAQYVTIGPPMLLLGFGIAGALFVGLSSTALQDPDREWLARASAKLLLVCSVWIATCAVVLLIPTLAFGWHTWAQGLMGGIGVITAWASSFAGYKGSKTPPGQAETRPKTSLSGLVLKVAPGLFIALLAVGLAILTNLLLSANGAIPKAWWDHNGLLTHTTWLQSLAWSAVFILLSWVMARYININRFSLAAMYRDRLIRAYLGASNPKRKVNSFTGFSQTDNFQMHSLNPALRPFHVLNLTLNLVGGNRLSWQQRKAESLTISPLHCGSANLGYRDSSQYGGKDGISLGTAMTVSGAAASPNMGYHSSPIIGLIMTLFNVRLGAWFGNPGIAGGKSWKNEGPRSAVASLVSEAFGLTTDASEYVYLSDGGHFENLGIYEMILRRCATIVVIDSGCDADFTYEDLGNALRKIRIDLRIPITFDEDSSSPLRERKKRCALATIHYSAVDQNSRDGQLLYIKPMFLGHESPDVASYHASHPEFPHQSTAEQWFDESQTESYRMLGLHTIDEMFRGWNGGLLSELKKQVEEGYLGIDKPAIGLGKTAA